LLLLETTYRERPMLVRIDTTQVAKSASRQPVMVLSAMFTETCESCGREFGCGAQDDACWCKRVALGRERLAILREHFERCLCPDCLAVAARDSLPSG
jgi:Cysteine-rich CWC